MKNLFLAILIFSVPLGLKAQQLERTVINSCGNSSNANGITLRTSIGEPIITKKGNAKTMLSQGFYTGSFQIISNDNAMLFTEQNSSYTYPNPTNSWIYFKSPTANNHIEVVNVLGQVVLRQPVTANSVNLESLTPDIYILKIYSSDNQLITSSKIIKL